VSQSADHPPPGGRRAGDCRGAGELDAAGRLRRVETVSVGCEPASVAAALEPGSTAPAHFDKSGA